jgi:Ca-activated chloride channel family protein
MLKTITLQTVALKKLTLKKIIMIGGVISALAFVLTGCGESLPQETLTVLAGSELSDLQPKLNDIRKKTGVTLQFEYIGTLDGAEEIVNGTTAYDLGWFSHAKYLTLLQEEQQGENKVMFGAEPIGLSPVIPAIRQSLVERWGWDRPDVSWSDIAEKAKSGKLRYAMTDPTASNSGFSAVIGLLSALSSSGDTHTANHIGQNKFNALFSGLKLTAASSKGLAKTYVKEQDSLDGMFNYESVVISLNQSGQLKEKLVPIFPHEGVVIADYPLLLLNRHKKAAFNRLIDYFKTPDFQQWMVENTNRRAIIPQVELSRSFPVAHVKALPFPTTLEQINAILLSFLNEQRTPETVILALDISGSMKQENRMKSLQNALLTLTGGDKTSTGQFAKFRTGEQVIMLLFDNRVRKPIIFKIDPDNQALKDIARFVHSLTPHGGTAIYNAMVEAYMLAYHLKKKSPEHLYSIVLLTDGRNQGGYTLSDFEVFYRNNKHNFESIRTFPILFGNTDDHAMHHLAELTGGKYFDTQKTPLKKAFKTIRGYHNLPEQPE